MAGIVQLALLPALLWAGADSAPTRHSLDTLLRLDRSLSVNVTCGAGGHVSVDGYDGRRPKTPFTFDWGDGPVTEGFFPVEHTYDGGEGARRIRVTAHYEDGSTDTVDRAVRLAPDLRFERRVPSRVHVLTPESLPPAGSGLEPFPSELFAPDARERLEYVLDVAQAIQLDLCNGDVAPSAAEGQLVARAAKGYGFSLWFTEPAAFACADAVVAPAPKWSVLFHEMAHGVTLNSPARRRIGADVTGCANAVMSESLAQILQHVTAALMADEPSRYGLSEDLAGDVWASAELTAGPLLDGARRYREGGLRYCSWNSPETDEDETLPTFMALAREFLLLADATGDLRGPTRRLMAAIETWGPADAERWQPQEAEAFRSTFMVAAVGHALGQDVRTHFRDMGFPIDDAVYAAVQARRMHAAD